MHHGHCAGECDSDAPGWRIEYDNGGYQVTSFENDPFYQIDEANKKITFKLKRDPYGTDFINNIVVTHPDRDHAEGLAQILEQFRVGALWMVRPWEYAAQLYPHFPLYKSVEAVAERLQAEYSYIYDLEKIARRRGIGIYAPFQGAYIGPFKVLAPSPARYLQLVIQSEKTPKEAPVGILSGLLQAAAPVIRFIRAGWGSEKFSAEATSAENEMSVIQYAILCGDKILLTGDAGRDGLTEAAHYAVNSGLSVPVNKFQAPHHGGRRNLSSELLDFWVGPQLTQMVPAGQEKFTAVISSAKEDTAHPRNAVLRALRHRGAFILTTEDAPAIVQRNSTRTWNVAENVPYPDEQEED